MGRLNVSPISFQVTRAEVGAVALLTVAVAVHGVYWLEHASYWFDEIWSVDAALLPVSEMLRLLTADFHPPGYHLLLAGWVRLFGTGEGATRVLSLLFGAATLPLVWLTARNLGLQARGALAAAALYGASENLLFYMGETRPYAMLLFLACLALVFVTWPGGRRRMFLAAWGVGLLAVFTHYGALFIFVPAVAALALVRYRPALLALVPLWVLPLLPWGAVVAAQARRFNQKGWLKEPTFNDLQAYLSFSLSGLSGAVWVTLGLLGVAAFLAFRDREPRRHAWLLVFPLGVGALFVASWVIMPVFHTRYLLTFLPWLALTAGFVVEHVRAPRLGTALAVMGSIALAGGAHIRTEARTVKNEDWRGAARYVSERRGSEPVILTAGSRYFRVYFPDAVVFDEGDADAVRRWVSAAPAGFWILQGRDVKPSPALRVLERETRPAVSAAFARARVYRLVKKTGS